MSGNSTMNHGVQQPLFAPVSQQGAMMGDDIDLNEIFADYFINEFEDPLNAYTNSMANYNGAAAAVALAQKQQQVNNYQAAAATTTSTAPTLAPPLPTGGIKTAFHAASAPAVPQQQQQQQMVNNGLQEPANKKMKIVGQQQPQQQYALAPATAAPIGRGAISGRLGFSMVGGQLALPHQQQQQQQQQQQVQQPPEMKQAAASTGVALPVGIGIRLGGIGGVAPATAQAAPRMAGGPAGAQYAMWGAPGGGVGMPGGMNSGGVMSEQAIAERRQRNREHAKRSRVRKKFMLESLQEQVRSLQKENVELRMLIQEKIPQHAQQILTECCSKNTLFWDPNEGGSAEGSQKGKKETSLGRTDFTLIESLTSGQQNFVLSDPRLPDNPVVYASPGFYVLTGYSQDQVLGRNCRFLQGPGTDPRAVDIIRTAIANGTDATTCILNYKADGSPFWNQFFVAALRDADNCIVNYVGVQCEVEPESNSAALEDKVNSILPLQTKEGEEETST